LSEPQQKEKSLGASLFKHPITIVIGGIILLAFYDRIENVLIQELIKEIGMAIIISGTIVFMLETGHFKNYFMDIFKYQLIEILIDNKYIEGLSVERKENLKELVDKSLYFGKREYDLDGLWGFLNTEVVSLLDNYYYDVHHVTIDCYMENSPHNELIIRKRMHRRIVFVNPTHDGIEVKIPINCNTMMIEGYKNEQLLKIISASVGKQDYIEEFNRKLENKRVVDESTTRYSLNFCCNYSLNIPPNSDLEIEYVIESLVPATDLSYTHKMSKPCKNYLARFTIHSDAYEVEGHGFAFNDDDRIHSTRDKHWMQIEYRKWILPGDGTVFLLNKIS